MAGKLTQLDLDELEAVGCDHVIAAPGEDRRFKKLVRLGLLVSMRHGGRVFYTATDLAQAVLRTHRPIRKEMAFKGLRLRRQA